MNVSFACPHCDATSTDDITVGGPLDCRHCHSTVATPDGAWDDGELRRCLVCGSSDLFVRKDFPQRLGLAIVVAGFAVSCVTWYFYWTYVTFAVLFATALADMGLFFIVGESLVCYRCHAEFRGIGPTADHRPFDLETHERYRQQVARLGRAVAPATVGDHSSATEAPVE